MKGRDRGLEGERWVGLEALREPWEGGGLGEDLRRGECRIEAGLAGLLPGAAEGAVGAGGLGWGLMTEGEAGRRAGEGGEGLMKRGAGEGEWVRGRGIGASVMRTGGSRAA